MRSVFHRDVKEVVGAGWLWAERSLLSLILLQSLVVTSESAEVMQQAAGPGFVLIEAENMLAPGSGNTWNWSNERIDNLGRAKLEITSAGVRTSTCGGVRMGPGLAMIVLAADESYEPTDEISEERPPDDILHGNVEPNEPEPNEPEPIEPAPSDVQPAAWSFLDQALKRTAFDIGPEVYSFKYEEPGFMKEEGMFYGVRLGYTFRDWIPSSPEEAPSGGGTMFRGEARFAYGQVDYDGALMDGTPLTINNIDDFAFEGRLLLGADRLGEITAPILSTLYTGLGYRYLNDDPSIHPAGYERESKYIYLPLGYQVAADLEAGWALAVRLEYDIFLWGNQRSHLSDVNPMLPDVDNKQDSGFGYRASLHLQRSYSDGIFIIEPFFRFWDIDDSEVSSFGYEPANKTTEVGISVIWMF